MVRRLSASLIVLFVLVAAAAGQVKVSLVAGPGGLEAGRPFTVALRIDHEPHWHTYWIQPGTGLPTTLEWRLPPGWSAGPIQWPAPATIRIKDGPITGNGYEGVVYLPVTLSPPADLQAGESVTLEAEASWLMCAETCVPGEGPVSLRVTAGPVPAVADPGVAATLASLPRASDAWSASASRSGNTITLSISPAGPRREAVGDVWFFAEDALVAYDEPQVARPRTDGGVDLGLTVSASPEGDGARLVGVVTRPEGWALSDGSRVGGLRIDVPLEAPRVDVAAAPAPSGGLGGTVLLALVGGLILNLMPCVFPVLGIKVLGFVNQAGSDRRKVTLHGLTFTAGVLASFWLLAGSLALLRAGGDQLGWGFQLQSPAFVFALAAVMLVFALSMSGVFEFGLSATGVGAGLQMKDGYAGSFFTGVLATVVATPCSAPFLAPALGAALALPAGASFAVFTAIALGLSAPYLLLSLFPGAVSLLPRPGAWMETFRQAMAFPLYGTVGYLIWVLAGQVTEAGLLSVLLGLTLAAMGVWAYGRLSQPGASAPRVRAGLALGGALLGGGLWLGWPTSPAPDAVVWEPWSADRVAAARAEGRPVYVDFTARWCATCQSNKRLVFASDEVRRVFRDRRVVALKADWTNKDPLITAELARWGRSAVPFNLVYLPGKAGPDPLPELLSPGIVLEALGGR